jgi:hypothetical protein
MINIRDYSYSMTDCIIPEGVNCSNYYEKFYYMRYLNSVQLPDSYVGDLYRTFS